MNGQKLGDALTLLNKNHKSPKQVFQRSKLDHFNGFVNLSNESMHNSQFSAHSESSGVLKSSLSNVQAQDILIFPYK